MRVAAVVGFAADFIFAGIGAVAAVAATSAVTIATAVTAAVPLSTASAGNRPNHEGYRAKHGGNR